MGLDPVLTELDAEIVRLQDEMKKVQDFRAWWVSRHSPTPAPPAPAAAPPTPAQREVKHKDGTTKTTREWIRTVLDGGSRMRPAEIARAARQQGWVTTSKHPPVVVRNTLVEMVDKGEAVRDSEGFFGLPGSEDDTQRLQQPYLYPVTDAAGSIPSG